jgi:hypothetical protein
MHAFSCTCCSKCRTTIIASSRGMRCLTDAGSTPSIKIVRSLVRDKVERSDVIDGAVQVSKHCMGILGAGHARRFIDFEDALKLISLGLDV